MLSSSLLARTFFLEFKIDRTFLDRASLPPKSTTLIKEDVAP